MMRLRSLALSAVAATSGGFAFADEYDNWQTGSYLDVSYTKNWNHPFTGFNEFRVYDGRNDNPMIRDLTVRLRRARGDGIPFGMTFDLWTGRNSSTDNAYDPAGDRWQIFKQAYFSFGNDDMGLDFGKFNSWMGFENRDAIDNINNSRSFTYGFMTPRYHTGVRLWKDFGNGVDAGIYGVQGWNETRDSNDEFSWGGHIGFKRNNWGARINVYDGTEGGERPAGFFGLPVETEVTALNGNFIINPNDRWMFALDVTSLDVENVNGDFNMNSFAVYARYMLNDKWTIGARYEDVTDEDGGILPADENYRAITVNFDYAIQENGKFRVEWRQDNSDSDLFAGRSSFKDNQATWSLSYQIKTK